jgi:recombination protein RecR
VNLPNCPELEKKALRLILHLLKQDPAAVEAFGEAVLKMRREIKFCQPCFNVAKCNK